jgi:hypothetical protein
VLPAVQSGHLPLQGMSNTALAGTKKRLTNSLPLSLLCFCCTGEQLCSFTYVAAGLTAPLAAGVIVTEVCRAVCVT